ncbi:hypothetical protein E2C01_006156 [Portunus trituberculatus]|uniref:Secreted protein n=1 Tax=Portunus trituberculatus TaxID=210409 RepID=A0A5B7CUI3_PORTR|nr:hypothetical protein [Portunus trituberculatus]
MYIKAECAAQRYVFVFVACAVLTLTQRQLANEVCCADPHVLRQCVHRPRPDPRPLSTGSCERERRDESPICMKHSATVRPPTLIRRHLPRVM